MKLKRVGFYKELKHGDKHGESLYELISLIPNLNEDKIISYLKSGTIFCVSPGIVQDVLSKDEKIIGSLKILTDGVWIWPSDLVYYIQEYHVSLDNDFISHMCESNWMCITMNTIDLEKLEF